MRPVSSSAWPQLTARARVLMAKYRRLAAQLDEAGATRASRAVAQALVAVEDIGQRRHAGDGVGEALLDADRMLTRVRPVSTR